MGSRRRRNSGSSFWSDRFPRVVNSCLLVCVLFNFVALFYGVKSSSPKVVHHLDSVTTNHFFVVTQYVASVSSPFSSAGSIKSVDVLQDSVGREIPVKYHYMVVDGVPMIRYYGRDLSSGDVMSYGRIKSIFPDRVELEGSVYLRNTDNPDEHENMGIVKNE